jgi:hypothetical protein
MAHSQSVEDPCQAADAVRYVVLCKLASGLRHTMLGDLQTIELTAELCARMLESGQQNDELRAYLGKIPAQTKVAAKTCRSMVEWLRPGESSVARLGDAIDECLKLAGDDWMLRGVTANLHLSDATREATVSRSQVCELVVTSLLTLVDRHSSPLDIDLSADLIDGHVDLKVQARVSSRTAPLVPGPVHGTLDWDDVLLLAEANGIPCECHRERESIALRFARQSTTVLA